MQVGQRFRSLFGQYGVDIQNHIAKAHQMCIRDSANNDMAGDEEGAWKTAFEDAGYEVITIVEGLGQLEAIQDLLVQHAQAAAAKLG